MGSIPAASPILESRNIGRFLAKLALDVDCSAVYKGRIGGC